MKSLSITVLVTVVLLAAGLIVVYKSPAPEIMADSYVLRVTPSKPELDSKPVESEPVRTDTAGAADSRDAALEKRGEADIASRKLDDRLVTDSEPPRYRPRFGVSREVPRPVTEEKTAEHSVPSPAAQTEPERDAKSEMGAATAPASPRPLPRVASTEDLIAKLARETAEAEALARAEAGEKAPPGEPPAPVAADHPGKLPVSATAGEGKPQPEGKAEVAAAAVPERPIAPAAVEKPADTAITAVQPETHDKTLPAPTWQTVTVTRADELKPAAPLETRPGAVARQPLPPAPQPRAGASPPIPRARTAAIETRPPTLQTTVAEERNAAETKTAVLGISRIAAPETSGPRIGIVIRDLGLDERNTYNAITNLGANVTLAFSPYGRDAKGWAMKARQDGHEVFLGIPMEPTAALDAEMPNMLLASLPREENLRRLDWLTGQIGEVNGVINIMGGRLSQTPEAMRALMEALKQRGLPYLDDGEAAHPLAILTAAKLQLRYRVADLRVTDERDGSNTAGVLARLEAIARENGSAIAVVPADTETIRQVIIWSSKLQEKGIKLVPASQIIGVATLP